MAAKRAWLMAVVASAALGAMLARAEAIETGQLLPDATLRRADAGSAPVVDRAALATAVLFFRGGQERSEETVRMLAACAPRLAGKPVRIVGVVPEDSAAAAQAAVDAGRRRRRSPATTPPASPTGTCPSAASSCRRRPTRRRTTPRARRWPPRPRGTRGGSRRRCSPRRASAPTRRRRSTRPSRSTPGAPPPGRPAGARGLASARPRRRAHISPIRFPDRETLRRLGLDPEKAYGRAGDEPR